MTTDTTLRRARRTGIAVTAIAGALTASVCASAPAVASGEERPRPDTALQQSVDAVAAAGGIGVVASASGPSQRFDGAAGVRAIDTGQPARPGDVSRVGSITKSMVATVAMQEAQAGRWTLGTTVDQVVPGLLPGHGDVTLEQLLSHRSGLPDYLAPIVKDVTTGSQLEAAVSRHFTDRQLVGYGLSQPWLFTPGTSYTYSNTNYVVVGLMLQQATGHSVADLVTQRIIRPLGLRETVYPTRAPWPSTAHLTDYARLERPYNLDVDQTSLFSSAGALVSTPKDLDRFYDALLAGRLVSKDLVASMVTPRSSDTQVYGLGIITVGDPCPGPNGERQVLVGHTGATFGTETYAFSSADGTRQATITVTGRSLTSSPSPTAKPANDFLIAAFSASCPRPVTAPKAVPNAVPVSAG